MQAFFLYDYRLVFCIPIVFSAFLKGTLTLEEIRQGAVGLGLIEIFATPIGW